MLFYRAAALFIHMSRAIHQIAEKKRNKLGYLYRSSDLHLLRQSIKFPVTAGLHLDPLQAVYAISKVISEIIQRVPSFTGTLGNIQQAGTNFTDRILKGMQSF